MHYYAVIDLGSNSIRLVVYEAERPAHGTATSKDFRSVIDEKKIAGLSAYVQDGAFTIDGIKKAAEVLNEHLRRARNFDCRQTRIFATAVLRNCTNSHKATKAISEAIGAPIEILSDHEEAHLGFVGATSDRTIEKGTLIDIGGGSTELTAIEGGKEQHTVSIPQGSVSSYAQHVEKIMPTKKEMRAIERSLCDKLYQSASSAQDKETFHAATFRADQLYGIGGSPRAVMRLYATAFNAGFNPKTLDSDQITQMLALLVDDPRAFCHLAVKAAPDRLHTIVPGCVIILVLMRELKAGTLEICKYGVREGFLIERILNEESSSKQKEK